MKKIRIRWRALYQHSPAHKDTIRGTLTLNRRYWDSLYSGDQDRLIRAMVVNQFTIKWDRDTSEETQ
jgi:hypothetical protein